MVLFNWKVLFHAKTPLAGEAVGPRKRMSWIRNNGIGMKQVVALFGATFVFPIVMAFDPNLAIFFSGLYSTLFLIVMKRSVPVSLGISAAFVASVVAIRARGDNFQLSGIAVGTILLIALYHLVRQEDDVRSDPDSDASTS